MKRFITLAGVAVLGFGTLAACSPDSTDFKTEGEDFIEKDDGDVATELGYTFENASCDKPSDTEVGTTYECTADDDEGDSWDFTIEITGERELTVSGVYNAKLVREFVVEALSGAGTLDEACTDDAIAAVDEDELKAAVADYSMNATPSAESEALVTDLVTGISETCLS